MVTEPTLGQRILDAANRYKDAHRGGLGAADAWADIHTLAARADAAERLAVAVVAVADAAEQVESTLRDDRIAVKREWLAAKDEGDNALAAWRAINGEVADG